MLIDLLKLEKNDIISITGSGGKTSLLFYLANELKNYKTLISTTTKIFRPNEKQYDHIYIDLTLNKIIPKVGINVVASSFAKEKLCSPSLKLLQDLIPAFDFTILESDGSKSKFLKAWNDNEPVIIKNTTKTIGIINLKLLGEKITETNVHNSQIFINSFVNGSENIITVDVLKNIILSNKGIFKNAVGVKILFINIIETTEDLNNIKNLFEKFNDKELQSIDKIIYGSIKNKSFSVFLKDEI